MVITHVLECYSRCNRDGTLHPSNNERISHQNIHNYQLIGYVLFDDNIGTVLQLFMDHDHQNRETKYKKR